MPVDLLFEINTVKLIHKCLYNSSQLLTVILKLFERGNAVRDHNTRHSSRFHIQSSCDPKSISFYGPSMWSKLPLDFQSDSSIKSFLKRYHDHLLRKFCND